MVHYKITAYKNQIRINPVCLLLYCFLCSKKHKLIMVTLNSNVIELKGLQNKDKRLNRLIIFNFRDILLLFYFQDGLCTVRLDAESNCLFGGGDVECCLEQQMMRLFKVVPKKVWFVILSTYSRKRQFSAFMAEGIYQFTYAGLWNIYEANQLLRNDEAYRTIWYMHLLWLKFSSLIKNKGLRWNIGYMLGRHLCFSICIWSITFVFMLACCVTGWGLWQKFATVIVFVFLW